jgi:prolyl 4-hydroxylase
LDHDGRARAEKLGGGEIEVPVTEDDPGPAALVPQVLSWMPRAFVVPDFVDPVERAHLIVSANPHLRPSKVLQRGSGAVVSDQGRTSGEMSFMNPLRDVVVNHVEERLSRLAMLPLAHGEPLVMLHYGPGDEYQTHVDYFDPSIPGREKGLQTGGQRVITILTYLNQPEAGGETVFPEVDLTVPPRAGMALLFFNTLPNGGIDRLSRHAGAPVRGGEKWLATRWFRERPVDQPPPPKEPRTAAPGGYSASFRI